MRLFAAVELDETAREALLAAVRSLRRYAGVRWTPAENLHLTLRFFGDCDEATAEGLRGALRALGPPPEAVIPLAGPRYFPGPQAPRVLLARAQAPPPFFAYQLRIERAARALGIPAERQAYVPHVTLGRIRDPRSAGRLSAEAARLAGDWATLRVWATTLIESRLTPQGAIYRVLERYAPQSE